MKIIIGRKIGNLHESENYLELPVITGHFRVNNSNWFPSLSAKLTAFNFDYQPTSLYYAYKLPIFKLGIIHTRVSHLFDLFCNAQSDFSNFYIFELCLRDCSSYGE